MKSLTVDHRGRVGVVAAFALALVVAALAIWSAQGGGVEPRTVEGWASPNRSGTAISLHVDDDGAGEGYIVAGARWVGNDNVWHDGTELPTCIGNDPRSRTAVQLSVVTVELDDGTSWDQVVVVRCLG